MKKILILITLIARDALIKATNHITLGLITRSLDKRIARNQGYLFIILIFFLFPMFSYALTASVDRNTLSVGETFTLTISTDKSTSDNIDLNSLSQDFELFGTSRSSQIRMLNNQMSAVTQWSISLYPKHAGHITIPSITLGNEKTQALSIDVQAAAKQSSQKVLQNKHVFFESSVSPKDPYVNSEIIYDLKLYYDVVIHNENLLSPKLADADIERLDEPKVYVAHRDGKPFQVFEQRFAFFPKKSGLATIEPPVLSGMIEDPKAVSSQMGDFILQGIGKPFRITGEPVALDIQAIPSRADAAGFAAPQFTITDTWSNTSNDTMHLGEPYTRTVVMKATGLKAEQLPTLEFDNHQAGLKVYPDKPQFENTVSDEGIIGTRTEKIAYIPTQNGQLTVSPLSVTWWNTTSKQYETTTLKARSFAVSGEAKENVSTTLSENKVNPASPLSEPAVKTIERVHAPTWLLIALGLAIMIILVLMILLFRQSKNVFFDRKADKSNNEKFLLDQIHISCEENDPEKTRQHLLRWMRTRYPNKTILSVENVKEIFSDEACHKAIDALMQACYQESHKPFKWEGDLFWEIFSIALKKEKISKRPALKNQTDLPTLNP